MAYTIRITGLREAQRLLGTNFCRFFNGDDSGADENTDDIHICDLPDFIAELQSLLEAARAYY